MLRLLSKSEKNQNKTFQGEKARLKKSRNPKMSFLEYKQDGATPPKLKAITINGAIHVESEADRKKKEEKRKERKSRWDQTSSRNSKVNLVVLILRRL